MRKLSYFLTMVAIAIMSMGMVGCDDNHWDDGPGYPGFRPGDNPGDNPGGGQGDLTPVEEAALINGEWDGQMKFTEPNEDGSGTVSHTFYANMKFVQYNSNSAKGSGTEIDYTLDEKGNVADQSTLTFKWSVADNGNIYVYYDDGGSYVMDIHATQKVTYCGPDQDNPNRYVFYGYMTGYNESEGREIAFDWTRVEASNNAKTRALQSAASSFGKNIGAPAIDKFVKFSLPTKR